MNSVQRTRGMKKLIRRFVCGQRVQRYVIAGDGACREMVRTARSRRQPGPSDRAILACARFDLTWEIVSGFWEYRAAA